MDKSLAPIVTVFPKSVKEIKFDFVSASILNSLGSTRNTNPRLKFDCDSIEEIFVLQESDGKQLKVTYGRRLFIGLNLKGPLIWSGWISYIDIFYSISWNFSSIFGLFIP